MINFKKIMSHALPLAFAAILIATPVLAADQDPWTIFRTIFKGPLIIIGAFMFIFGAISMGFAFAKDNAAENSRGLWVFISGAMILILAIWLLSEDAANAPWSVGAPFFANNDVENPEMATMLGQIAQWIPALGMIAMFWGMFEMAKAMKDDDAAGKHKGLAILVAGVALWQIVNFMKWILGWG